MSALEKVVRHLGLYKFWFHFFGGNYSSDNMDMNICKQELENYNPNPKTSCIQEHTLKTNQVKVSIIVPAYNASNYIVQCINSLITQITVYTYEIIVVNDGSTDNTLDLIKGIKSDNLKVIDKPNGGISSARNMGIINACGEYLIFCDSDDYMDKNAVQCLIERAEQTNADIVEGVYCYVSETGKRGHIVRHKSENEKMVNTFGVPWCKCIRKSLFQIVCFPLDYWFEDSVIHHVILPMANKIEWVDDIVYYYRTNSNGATANSVGNPKSIDSLWILISLFEDRKKLNIASTTDYYKYMLNMMRLGFHRTKLLPENIRKDFYYVYASFLKKEFDSYEFGLLNLDFANIQNLVTNINYSKYYDYFRKT